MDIDRDDVGQNRGEQLKHILDIGFTRDIGRAFMLLMESVANQTKIAANQAT